MKRLIGLLVSLLLATVVGAAEKSEVINQSFPAQVDKLVLVDAGPLDVTARVAEVPEIRVKVELVAGALSEAQAKDWVEAHRPSFEDSEGGLRIVAPDPPGTNLAKGVIISKARLELVVPPSVRVDLSTSSGNLNAEGEFAATRLLRLRTSSGDLELTGWASEIEARSTSGSIRVRASRTISSLLARSASGDIEITGGVRSLRCDASTGDIHAEGLVGSVSILTTSGAVTAKFDSLTPKDTVGITTTSGRIRLTLPPGSAPGGELVSAGEIRSTYPGDGDARGGRLVLSGPGPHLAVTTDKGKIELN